MNRRRFLRWGTAGIAGVAGCAGLDGGDDPAATGTTGTTEGATPTPTATATPTQTPTGPLRVVSVDAPSVVDASERYTVEVVVENVGDERAFFESSVERRPTGGTDWERIYSYVSVPVAPGDRTTETVEVVAAPRATTVEYRLPATGTTWTVEVTAENVTPEIQFVTLVSEWEEAGDASANAIDQASAGDPVTVATKYRIFSHDGTVDATIATRILRASTDEVVTQTVDRNESQVDQRGYMTWEWAQGFKTAGWDPGEYRAEAVVRDDVSGEESDPGTTRFELV